jgi:pimeloyl-ACP methyl ester carboxylesterase
MRYNDSGGHGEPLVLIHAAGFADWFVPLEREPAVAGLRLIRVTRTGYSDPAPTEPMSVADHADETADLLRCLGIGRARPGPNHR